MVGSGIGIFFVVLGKEIMFWGGLGVLVGGFGFFDVFDVWCLYSSGGEMRGSRDLWWWCDGVWCGRWYYDVR